MSNTPASDSINIRQAVPEDEPQILGLLPYLADFDIPPRRDPQDLWSGDADMARQILTGQISTSFIDVAVHSDGHLIGLIMVSMREELLSHAASAHLEAIVVNPKVRSMGLGKRLMRYCEQRARDLGAGSLTLHVFQRNQRARALYAGQDFDEELIRAIKWLE